MRQNITVYAQNPFKWGTLHGNAEIYGTNDRIIMESVSAFR